jgi:alpha-methylacyl-CoA racemase
MMLADMGAEVVRIDRKGESRFGKYDIMARGRRSVALNLKSGEGVKAALKLIENADVLIEGFRPGVMERLGLGPKVCQERNPKLVYGRMTGWGQEGPLAHAAGHDINYIALSGALAAIGRPGEPPPPPLNLVGDFGGGAMMLAFGIVCALLEARNSGMGQVVDAAMTDGAALLMAMMYGAKAAGRWSTQRGVNRLDGGAPFYDTYECSDGKYICIGSYEPQFYGLLLEKCGIDDPAFKAQLDVSGWPELKRKIAGVFRVKTRDEWCAVMEGTDVCFAPVLDMDEAPHHPHNRARNTFVEIDGVVHPAPAPRFSRTPPEIQRPPAVPGEHTEAALSDWGFSHDAIARLRQSGAI